MKKPSPDPKMLQGPTLSEPILILESAFLEGEFTAFNFKSPAQSWL